MTSDQREIVDKARAWATAVFPENRTPDDHRTLALVEICEELDEQLARYQSGDAAIIARSDVHARAETFAAFAHAEMPRRWWRFW